MDAIEVYMKPLQERLERLISAQRPAIDTAAERFAETVMADGWLYVFGTGHSHMMAEELFFRAGGSPCVRPILIEDLMLHRSASQSTACERESGRNEAILERYPVGDGDILLVASNSGRNAVPIELALAAKERGAYTMALTSLAHARQFESRHPSGKRLDQLVLDHGAPSGDAAVELEDLGGRVGAMSTALGAAVLQMVHVGAMHRLVEAGKKPEFFMSSNAGGDASNARLLEKYVGRVEHL